jgi:hypothetical protein
MNLEYFSFHTCILLLEHLLFESDENVFSIWVGKPHHTIHFEDLGVDRRIILKLILRNKVC